MNKTILLLAVLTLSACASTPGSNRITPTLDLLAGKCFSGYSFYRNIRTSLDMCFNDDGTHAFYRGKRHEVSAGDMSDFAIDAPVRLTDDGKIELRTFLRRSRMTLYQSGDGRLSMKGNYRYEGDTGGSLSLTEGSTEKTRQFRQELLYR